MIYYVSTNGNDGALGTKDAPFKTINHAAQIAVAGDTVRVFGGVYREWVNPKNAGTEDARITYEAVEGEKPVIKGSEIVTDWEKVEGTVWKKTLPNSMFGDWNPYLQKIDGDWFNAPKEYDVHLGDVYINGESMYEASSMEDLYSAEVREKGFGRPFPFPVNERILHPEKTVYRWYCEVTEEATTIWGNFQEIDPNAALIEINVRKCCFYPTNTGRNYITLRGFEIAHAACPWAPPTADQIAMVGPNWSKGWIIENNDIHDSKCSGISIGKESSTGDNLCHKYRKKSGYQYQMEAVFLALRDGWSKENIGSHVIRNNEIHDCGQTGIVGHLGCVFSRLEHNHIYNIARKMEFQGAELGGIKLHTAIDVVIENNNIHDTSLGTWLDWQAQGTRVTKNLYYNNIRDLMIEVTHGPCTVDNNILLSDFAYQDVAQGTAFAHNLILGYTYMYPILNRSTPYHFPHTTQVAGSAFTLGGDNRIYNNIFFGKTEASYQHPQRVFSRMGYMGEVYESYSTPEEYEKAIFESPSPLHLLFQATPQPMYVEENAYAGYAHPWRAEKAPILADGISVDLHEEDGEWLISLRVPSSLSESYCKAVTTDRLGTPRITEAPYDSADGTPIDFTIDILGNKRDESIVAGPFATLSEGQNKFVVWKK